MQRVLIATFLAALAVSAWDYAFWSSRLVESLQREPASETELMAEIENHLGASGEYVVGEEPTREEFRTGEHTYAEISFTRDGPSWYRPDIAGRVMVVTFVSLLPAGLLLFLLGGRLETFVTRFLTVALLGVTASSWNNLSYLVIQGGPGDLAMAYFLYDTVCWCIAAAILGKIVRPDGSEDRRSDSPAPERPS